ncbi:cell division protein FtsQ/DivIB [Glycomyces terrestris]|uniref:FtsQ-type POTRA domain-containing protein n=1 Tax=Glycomyces terrestris TaxID=2493553 RepID=A0A426V577_9ACTN|nr:FtsQ-type POTRA domain-containing protein [Glycomyces terrestris]RRS01968.1 FtsQ-type POTRA domain-containing protein [Glycomyces terrestris]
MRGSDNPAGSGTRRLVHVVRRGIPDKRLRLAVAGVLALLLAAFTVLWTVPWFEVRRIEVAGTAVLDPAEVQALGQGALGDPLLGADLDALAADVAALAPVASVDVSRSWPDALLVEVTERTPYMAVPTGDETFLMVDSDGVAFDEADSPFGTHWIVELDDPSPDDLATIEALAVLESVPADLADEVEHVEAPSPAGITLFLEGGRTVTWGDGSEGEQKAEVVDRLLAVGYEHVDVSAPDAPTVS